MSLVINNSPVRSITSQIVVLENDTTFSHADKLKSWEIQRVGENNKFFGFGISQRLNTHLIDTTRENNIISGQSLQVSINGYKTPSFYITEINRDEKTNELSITGYDGIYLFGNHTISELTLPESYTLTDFIEICYEFLNSKYPYINGGYEVNFVSSFNLSCDGANFDGSETIRSALDAIAEITGCVYFLIENKLVFQPVTTATSFTIGKEDYFELSVGNNRRLSGVCSATELGDNIAVNSDLTGTTQYFRDNPFLTLRDDIDSILNNLFEVVKNMTIAQFDCSWRGHPGTLNELGSKIVLITKDDKEATSYLFNDTIVYDGSLKETTEWIYDSTQDGETATNPTSLGEKLKLTYAKVDKVNKQIDLVASEASDNSSKLAQIQITTDNIISSVENIKTNTEESVGAIQEELATITEKVNLAISAEDVQILVDKTLENGIDKITTSTGFTFDEEGLTINKTGSEMKTTITEDGMIVYRDETEVLVADNEGVKAENLHATTYLIIGNNSRFEDYDDDGEPRTGCFWIGGIL